MPAMVDRTFFFILKYVNQTPTLASCAKCQRKFFTPETYFGHPFGAGQFAHQIRPAQLHRKKRETASVAADQSLKTHPQRVCQPPSHDYFD
jgi:hypothetical protein